MTPHNEVPYHEVQRTENALPIVTGSDLARRFLGDKVEGSFSQIEEPEVEVEAKGVKVKVAVEKLQIDVQLDSFSARLLWVGVAATLIGIVAGLVQWLT